MNPVLAKGGGGPAGGRNLQVPFMESDIVRWAYGSGLLQRYEANGLILRYDCFEVNRATTFLPQCRSRAILYYILEGNAYGRHTAVADSLLAPHRQYLRGAEHINGGKFVLTKGIYRCFYIVLPEALLSSIEKQPFLFPSQAVTQKQEHKHIEEILHCTYTDARLQSFLEARTLDLWQLYLGHHTRNRQEAAMQQHKLNQLIEYIGSHLGDNLSDALLAKFYGSSVPVFRRVFFRYFRQPTHHYVLAVRMEKAKELLLNTHHTIEQIAQEIGYTDARPFYREFQRHFSHTPNHLRHNDLT